MAAALKPAQAGVPARLPYKLRRPEQTTLY